MGVENRDDRHSADPVEAIKSLFDTEDDTDGNASKRPRMKIVGDLRHTDKKKRERS